MLLFATWKRAFRHFCRRHNFKHHRIHSSSSHVSHLEPEKGDRGMPFSSYHFSVRFLMRHKWLSRCLAESIPPWRQNCSRRRITTFLQFSCEIGTPVMNQGPIKGVNGRGIGRMFKGFVRCWIFPVKWCVARVPFKFMSQVECPYID